MNNRFKIILSFAFMILLLSCYDDKGNYDYKDLAELEISNIEKSYTVLGNGEKLKISPKIISSTEGEITENNPNFEFDYYVGYYLYENQVKKYWHHLNEGSLNFDDFIKLNEGQYGLWFKVTDKRTGLFTSFVSKLNVSSNVYEGWLLACNEGPEKRARLDMVSVISEERKIPSYDLLSSRGLPKETKNVYGFGFYPSFYSGTTDIMYFMTESGAYLMERNTFVTSEMQTINYIDYIDPTNTENPVVYRYSDCNFIVSDHGNAYAQIAYIQGGRFESLLNTDRISGKATYKVAPFIGYNAKRPWTQSELAIFYDETNKRFMGWDPEVNNGMYLFPLVNNEDNALFSYQTGMDLIYMDGTGFGDGNAMALLKDKDGKFYICGILLYETTISQKAYYPDIKATNIDKATQFAFHSQFPYMYYLAENKVYCYNFGTGTTIEVLNLPNEEITKIKFNLFANYLEVPFQLNKNDDPEFMNQQYQLLVGSYDNSDPINGGHFRMYKTDKTDGTLTKINDWNGFGRIVDILYRERRANMN